MVQSRNPVLTSFSKKNFTSPISESLIPSDFSIPRSPFSTAMKTERRCSKSDRIKCKAAPKSSIVWDSGKYKCVTDYTTLVMRETGIF